MLFIFNMFSKFYLIIITKGTGSGLSACTACTDIYYLTGTTCGLTCADGTYYNA